MPIGIKLTPEVIKNLFEENGYKVLLEDFKKAKDKVLVLCPNGHVVRITYDNFKQGKRCGECSHSRKHTYQEVYDYFILNDCLLLSEEYTNCKTNLEYMCSCGKTAKITFDNFKNKNERCSDCRYDKVSIAKTKPYEEVKKYVEQYGNELLTSHKEYRNASSEILVKCKCENIFKTNYVLLTQRECKGCVKCAYDSMSQNRKRSREEIEEMMESWGFDVLDYKYVDNTHFVTYACVCGNIESVNFSVFLHKKTKQCNLCGLETRAKLRRKYTIDEVSKLVSEKNWTLLSDKYVSVDDTMRATCNNGHNTAFTIYRFLNNCGCRECFVEMYRGEQHHNWQGGISQISSHLRQVCKDWIQTSLMTHNYRCHITGSKKNLKVHHPYSFNLIVFDTLQSLNLEVKPQLSDYSYEELCEIDERFLELNNEYVGIPLAEETHVHFHKIYGYGNNTPEQLEEYIQRYKTGEFKELQQVV